MCPNNQQKLGPYAFTLIELVIVLAILAIAAAIVVPMASSAGGLQLRAAANLLAADLEYAKSMAISRGQRYSVVFDTLNETYQIEDPNGTVIAHPVKKGFPYRVDFRHEGRLSQVNIAAVSFNATNEVKFDPLGTPFDGGDGPLNSGTVTLQAGGASKVITVAPVTGFVTISN
jgi:prepilin-type N-terminal cleavage/methylation domain-containing protein